jgi:Lipase (class 3)
MSANNSTQLTGVFHHATIAGLAALRGRVGKLVVSVLAVTLAMLLLGSAPARAQGQMPSECRRDLNPFNLFNNPNFLSAIARCLSDVMPPGDQSIGEKMMDVEPPVLKTSRDMAQVIFGLYQKQHPIGIARVWTRSSAGDVNHAAPMCLVVLSGTEPTVFAQATTLPEDVRAAILNTEDDDFFYAIMLALGTAVQKGYCDRGARLVLAGHSLGGMEAQNVAANLIRQNANFYVSNIVTFGSPLTAGLPGRVNIQRFTTIGDPIPYTTYFTGTYREVRQTVVDDRTGPPRFRAIDEATRERNAALRSIPNPLDPLPRQIVQTGILGKWLSGSVTAHMQYPNVRELQSYDTLGAPIGSGITTSLVIDNRRTIRGTTYGFIHVFPAPRLRRAAR